VAIAIPSAWSQARGYRPPPNYLSTGKPDQAEGARILSEFHQAGIAGTYWLDFTLRVMPREGAETVVAGQMIGTRSDQGPLTRLMVGPRQWLIQTGLQPATWTTGEGKEPQLMTAAATLDPLAGTDFTVFDLQMPFLYWTDFVYEGLARIRGRPAHSFVLYPPADLAASRPGLTGVRVLLDTQFQALVQAEFLGDKSVVEKTISILDLKKVGDHWIPKSIDFRNQVTRGKTRFTVVAAALDLVLPPETFDPAALNSPAPVVASDRVERL